MPDKVKDCVNIFICTHSKSSKRCCAAAGAEEVFLYFKDALDSKKSQLDKSKKYKVVKTSCLGRCSIGPNIYITPDNVWYNYARHEDIDRIIDEHLIGQRIVGDLLNPHVRQNEDAEDSSI